MKREFDRDKFRVLFYKTKLTQAEFGYVIGKTAGAISQYLHGVVKPKPEVVEKMAKALHCTVDDLLEGEVEKPYRGRETCILYGRGKRSGSV